MSSTESAQIDVARVVCILFMMTVHVYPGLSAPSWVSTAPGWLWGEVVGHWLGRASVAALSFFSGFLLQAALGKLTVGELAKRRAASLLLPMLVWNLAFVALKAWWTPGFPDSSDRGALPVLLADMLGLTGPTANLSLFFLRDLFVSAIAVALLAPALRRAPVPLLALFLVLTLLQITEPIVFRPSLLFFMALGFVCRDKAIPLGSRTQESRCPPLPLSACSRSASTGSHISARATSSFRRAAC